MILNIHKVLSKVQHPHAYFVLVQPTAICNGTILY